MSESPLPPPYEYRRFGKFGFIGSLLIALTSGAVILFSVLFAPASVGNTGYVIGALVTGAVTAVASFFYLYIVGQRLYWRVDEQGITWRGPSLRTRQVCWEDLEYCSLRSARMGGLGEQTLELALVDGRRLRVGPSRRPGGPEPAAREALAAYSERYGRAGTALLRRPGGDDRQAAGDGRQEETVLPAGGAHASPTDPV